MKAGVAQFGEGSADPPQQAHTVAGFLASSESFDMLPTTPPESQYGSPPASPVRRPASMMKVPRNTVLPRRRGAEDEDPSASSSALPGWAADFESAPDSSVRCDEASGG
jgi:hypothetical protein